MQYRQGGLRSLRLAVRSAHQPVVALGSLLQEVLTKGAKAAPESARQWRAKLPEQLRSVLRQGVGRALSRACPLRGRP